jgi:hypothetical protein
MRFSALSNSRIRSAGACYYESLTRLRLLAARGEVRRVLNEAERRVVFPPKAAEVSRVLEGARAAKHLGERERATRAY